VIGTSLRLLGVSAPESMERLEGDDADADVAGDGRP